jgi:hypothetical protein
MNNEEIESLLRRARLRELPAGLKHRVLQAARQNAEPIAWAPRVTWASLAVCWSLIVLLRTTTPEVPTGTQPFDREAFLARAATLKFIVATGQFPQEMDASPNQHPLQMELYFRLPKATPQTSQPAT